MSRLVTEMVGNELDEYYPLGHHVVLKQWEAWLSQNQQWSTTMLAKQDGQLFDTEALWQDIRADLETRHDELLGD